MKILLLAAIAFLAGCAGLQSLSSAPGALLQSGKATGLMPHYVQHPVHTDHGRSWMLPQKKGAKGALIYTGDEENNDVYVYDYSSGKAVGTLTGFDEPYGGCVDAKGDVYITNYGAGTVVEYAHGGTKVIDTYDSGGTPVGCSVDSKGDVAVTSFDPGEAVVFAGGNPKKGAAYNGGACTYLWSMGYDHSGNLIGVGETSSGGRCYAGLLSGAKSISSLSFSGTIDFPGGTMWDGKYIALGDQEAGGTFNTGLYRATLKGSTLSPVGSEVTLTDCSDEYNDIIRPFIVGKKNTPVNDQQGKVVIGTNQWTTQGNQSCPHGIEFWHYPQGGNPFKGEGSETVLAVSIGT